MGILERSDFSRGWCPSYDAVHAPSNGLLRADNTILDEKGVLAIRRGSAKINGSALADLDVHSLFTAVLSGTRYRMAGAGAAVYANSTSIATGTAGSGDISFGSYLGNILWARSTTKKKYDGTTVRNWGIAAPNAAPTSVAIAADGKTFASFDSVEAPAFVVNEDDGTGAAFGAGYDGTANGALIINPNTTTGRLRVTKTFAAATDFTTYDAAQTGLDTDLIGFYVYITEPQYVSSVTLQIDFDTGTFQNNQYYYIWWFNQRDEQGNLLTATPSVGWNFLQVKRSEMNRYDGATAGLNWSTVRAVRVDVLQTAGGSGAQIRFDRLRIVGGSSSPLTGLQRYKLVAVYNSGSQFGKSAPTAASSDIEVTAQGVQLTVAAGVISALDAQVNELWVYRYNETLGEYYRSKVHTGGPWGGAQTINDTASNDSVLTTNLKIEATNTTPPDTIVGIVGPHYDRVLCLTATHVYPSQPRNVDSFDSEQAIRVGDASETAYWIAKVREELYVGTSKDVYRLAGDWTQRPDGLVNVAKVPMGLGSPPISAAIAQDGDTLIYLASDGWRQLGTQVPLTSGDVDLLYRGYTRHGVSPVNLSTGRLKAAITKGWFTALTPEGASTTSSTVLHRYVPALQRWYRHTYARNWRCVYREPDGTLVASDDAGFVWTLDTGTQDDGSDVAVVLWTPIEDNGQPNHRKDAWEIRVRANSGGATATVAVHLDGSGSSSTSFSVASSGLTPVSSALDSLSPYRQSQLRVTGSFGTFLWYDYTLSYRERAPIVVFAEPKPEVRGTRRRRFAGLTLVMDTLGGAASVTPVIDDVAQAAQNVTTSDAVSTPITFANVVGRDLWAKISKSDGFEYYAQEPIVVAEFPPVVRGRLPDNDDGYPFRKRLIGLRIRACTLGAARTFTPIVDGVSLDTFAHTSSADDPDDILHYFTTQQIGTEVAFSVDGNLEVYSWGPITQQRFPQPVRGRIADSNAGRPGPKQITGLRIRACTLGEARAFTPIVDGTSLDASSFTTHANEPDELILSFSTPKLATDIAFSVDGNIELYEWAPLVDAALPVGRTLWDSGPVDLGTRAAWVPFITLKAKLTGTLTITPYVDDVAQTAITVAAQSGNPITTYDAYLTRPVRGRQVRFVLSASSAFYLYWLEPRYRVTGNDTDLRRTRLTVAA